MRVGDPASGAELSSVITRRKFLQGSAATAAAAFAAPSLLRRAGASVSPIEHVVVLTMENRSFDHFFGSLQLLEGRTDLDGLTGEEHNLWSNGDAEPVFHLGGNTCTRLDPPHEWTSVREQYAGGGESGYLTAVEHHHGVDPDDRPPDARDPMGFYTRADLPFAYGVADRFAICDRYRSPVAGPTLPNRHYLHAATSEGIWDNYLDSRDRSASPSPMGDPTYGFDFLTIYQRLSERGRSWRVYFTEAPFTMLYRWPRLTHPERFAPFSQFLVDALRGDLPAFTTIDPGYFTASDHAPQNVQLGQLFMASVYAALAASPVWDRTALFITYDEDGGFYDHGDHLFVPDDLGSVRWNGSSVEANESFEPVATDAFVDGEHAGDPLYGDFSLTGGRLPTMVLGPCVQEEYVSHTDADHTSILAFVEDLFGLDPLSERDRYRLEAGQTLADCFDLGGPTRPPEVLPVPSFHTTMFTDCASTYVAPAPPYLPGPRDPSNPGLDLNSVLAAAVDAGAIPMRDPASVRQTYLDAFRLVEELPDLI